jgi:hypothetical protein
MQALGLIWKDFGNTPDIQETCTPLREPVHYGARLLLNHWSEKQAKGGMVVGRDLPARELSPALRHLILYEPLEGGHDFRVRLAGSANLRRFGRDVTGTRISELFEGDAFEWRLKTLARVLTTREPCSSDVLLKRSRRDSLRFEVLTLPVLNEAGARWALGGIFYPDWVG